MHALFRGLGVMVPKAVNIWEHSTSQHPSHCASAVFFNYKNHFVHGEGGIAIMAAAIFPQDLRYGVPLVQAIGDRPHVLGNQVQPF